jgi:Domain of unknown function (DUF5122) beta-propeller
MPAAGIPGDTVLPYGGGDGRASIPTGAVATPVGVGDIAVQADGKTVVVGWWGNPRTNAVLRLATDGTIDPTWNGGTPLPVGMTDVGQRSTPEPHLELDAAGRVLFHGGLLVQRFTSAGAPDSAFSGDGTADLTPTKAAGAGQVEIEHMLPLSDGKTLVAVRDANGGGAVAVARRSPPTATTALLSPPGTRAATRSPRSWLETAAGTSIWRCPRTAGQPKGSWRSSRR